MEAPERAAAPISGSDNIPTFEELSADPEIAALLEFEPVPRANTREDGWSPPLQRMFIAQLARTGSPGKACDALGKRRSGIDKLYKKAEAESFRDAWRRAVELAQERQAAKIAAEHAAIGDGPAPFMDHRRKHLLPQQGPLPGQVRNEHGEWEDQESYRQRAEDAKDSIRGKLLRIRRLYLSEISECPGKRAAFEILTELPIDWDAAERGEAQPDEPYNRENQRQPDMVLLAESGWSFGEIGYGPDRKAEARALMDQHREEKGLPPIDWGQEG